MCCLLGCVILPLWGCDLAERAEPAPAPVAAPPEMVSPRLEARLATAAAEAEERGFVPRGEVSRDFLVEKDSLVVSVTLPSERCQVVTAVASAGLRELSIGVYDSGGGEIASASKPGAGLALRFCPDVPGMHYIAVRSVSGDGLVAVRRFEGPTGIDLDLEALFVEATPDWTAGEQAP